MKRKILFLGMLFSIFMFAGCDEDGSDKSGNNASVNGFWCFNAAGTATKIYIANPNALFEGFAINQWKDFADAGFVKKGDLYLKNISWKSGNNYTCQILMYKYDGSKPEKIFWDTGRIEVASDGQTLKIWSDSYNAYATLYKTNTGIVGGDDNGGNNGGNNGGGTNNRGTVSFWTATDFGCGSINVTLNGKGSGTLNQYFPSGSPSCGQSGTVSFSDLPYGTYSYSASCDSYSWSGSVTVDRSCVTMQLIR